ncbi:hypothetical protein WN48_06571 [Eufriesea mexicana]|uniref:Kinetochore protein SPC25 n=1 Tax=Eufriesea mexicana TaxID=516756 RepID=A0A310SFL6_9HYME|nr:PREDICTED: uncharacterized protein LOC108545376 [Eufriesea mexicana]OAD60105.1 hypothetical protein WN48_06571 [Eufriesea mexicana]
MEFNIDITYVLQNRDFSVLQKLVSHYYNFRSKIAAKVEDTIAYEIECMGKKTQSINTISKLQNEVERLKSAIDATTLQQKIVDKKIANANKQNEQLKTEVDDAKLKRDNLSIEIVDLKEESEKRKLQKVSIWSALKRVCHTFKEYLDFRIQLIDDKEHEQIKVFFFINSTSIKDEYFVRLLNYDNQWKVEQIQPALKAEHLTDFKGIVDFSKNSEVTDITIFLCKLRDIFIKYYLSVE